jgi:hypothetical protein
MAASKTFVSKAESESPLIEDSPRGVYQQVDNLVYHLINLKSDSRDEECRAVFGTAEKILDSGDTEAGNVVVHGLLEGVQNITSHIDAREKQDEFERFLGTKSRLEWDQLNTLWQQASAAAKSRVDEPIMTDENYSAIENQQIRRMIQASTRRLSSGRYVTLGDVVRYEKSMISR